MTGSAHHTCRVALVHHHQCVVLLCQVTDLVHGSHVAVHREHTVGNDDAETLGLSLLKALLQFLHVGIGIAVALCLAQTHAVDDGSVVQGIGNDGILVGQQRLEHTAVGIKASGIQDGVLSLEVLADFSLQNLVDIGSTADEAHAGHTEATAVQSLLGSLDEAGMVGKAQIIVGTEVQHFLASHLDFSLLGALYQTLVLVKSCFLDLCQSLAKMFFHFSVHSQFFFIGLISFLSCQRHHFCPKDGMWHRYYDPKLRFFVQTAKATRGLFRQISQPPVYKRKEEEEFCKKKLISKCKCLHMQKDIWRIT